MYLFIKLGKNGLIGIKLLDICHYRKVIDVSEYPNVGSLPLDLKEKWEKFIGG